MVFFQHIGPSDIFLNESIFLGFMQNIESGAEIGETRSRMHLLICTSWYCKGMAQRVARVRERAHALTRR